MLVEELVKKLKKINPKSTVYADICSDVYSLFQITTCDDVVLISGDLNCPYEERNETKSFNTNNAWKEV